MKHERMDCLVDLNRQADPPLQFLHLLKDVQDLLADQ